MGLIHLIAHCCEKILARKRNASLTLNHTTHFRPIGTHRTMLNECAGRICDEKTAEQLILLAIEDVTKEN